jgi:galacturan 1,4-alpha-galacturonidase
VPRQQETRIKHRSRQDGVHRQCDESLVALFYVVHGEKEESKGIDAKASGPGGSFDITKLGASGNGKTDSTKAVQEAWASACGGTGKQTILIPKGDFLVGQLNFTGPCKGDVTI